MNISELKSRLTKSIDFYKVELSQIRTGRASPQLISDILVDVYGGTKMTVKELGSITAADSRNLLIIPWDKSLIKIIAKCIRDSDPGLTATDEVDKVRVSIPELTEERRLQFVKEVSTKCEETKNSVRNIRQDAMKDIEKAFSDKIITEDEKFRQKEEVEKTVKEFIESVDKLSEDKKDELMRV